MSKKKQIEKQEQGERIYRKTLDGVPQLRVDTPVTYVVMEFQKSLRRPRSYHNGYEYVAQPPQEGG